MRSGQAASALQETLQALPDLLVAQVLAASQCILAVCHRLHEAGFLLDVLRNDLLGQFIRAAALGALPCGQA